MHDPCSFLSNIEHRFHLQTHLTQEAFRGRLFPNVCSSFLKHARFTLEDLRLNDNSGDIHHEPGFVNQDRFISDLKGFAKLKNIEIDEALITGRLVDVLSASVEHLVLLENDCCLEEPNVRFKDPPKLRAEYLPNLSSIASNRPFRGFRRRTYEKMGITFVKN